jgi:hypothetical protein
MDSEIKKKRGRKPKNYISDENVVQTEKKKRGRKKKYEIENFEKILNRNEENNFNHHVIYSDDDEIVPDDNCVKKIAFGNLDITVSKKVETQTVEEFKFKTRNHLINKDEYSSDEEKEVPVESFIHEKMYSENKKYVPKICSECKAPESIKKLRVITTTKDQIKKSTEWPEKCDVCCWWCCHTFENSPCTLPVKYDSARKRFTFVGLFCSWNCVKSYNYEKNDHLKYERAGLITLLIQQMYGINKAINIKAAPPRQTLKMFGGYLDIDTFRDPTNVDGYLLNLVKFNYIHPEISEVSNIKVKSEKKNLRLSRPLKLE